MSHKLLMPPRLLLVIAFLFLFVYMQAKRFVPKTSQQLSQQIDTNSQYEEIVIRSAFDLNGDTLKLPAGATLLFKKKGLIKNGHVVFGCNSLKRLRKGQRSFRKCSFSGTLNDKTLYISSFGVSADGKQDDAPIINDVLSVIDGKNCHLIFDCDGDYGISSPGHRNTVIVGSNTTITFRGKGFLKLLSTSKLV